MSVVQTLPDLYRLQEMAKKLVGDKLIEIHREVLCTPLKGFYPQATKEQIQGELLTRGLFNPFESAEIEGILKELEKMQVWEVVQGEFEQLKKLWDGPDVPIFIYPLTKNRPIIDGDEVKKNGVSYQNVLFLFIAAEIDPDDLKALLAHEYHHICRLSFLNEPPHEICLLETLLIEGMAECAVEESYGESQLSPWTKRYPQEKCVELWKKFFIRFLNVKGVDNHFPFLYGDESIGLPKWIGYCLGYRIVRSYIENKGINNQRLLYRTSSREMLEGSDFKV